MKYFKPFIYLIVAVFTLGLSIDVYAEAGAPSYLDSCRSFEIITNNKTKPRDTSGMKTAAITGYCEGVSKQFVQRYGNIISKTISEHYGTDIETSYSPESFCRNINSFLDEIPDILPLLYILTEPYDNSVGTKVTPLSLTGVFEDHHGTKYLSDSLLLNSSGMNVLVLMTTDIVNRGLKKTKAYNDLFGALYSANYKKALAVVAAYAQQEDVRNTMNNTRGFCRDLPRLIDQNRIEEAVGLVRSYR
jgi:hypothetical protein